MINQRQELGKEGEDFAADYLQKQGYEIIDRNFECKQGEIDIIAKDKNEYVFIEVKTRQNFHYGMPCEAVDERKQKHIWNATRYYIYSHKLEDQYIRIDVIEIYKRKNRGYYKKLQSESIDFTCIILNKLNNFPLTIPPLTV